MKNLTKAVLKGVGLTIAASMAGWLTGEGLSAVILRRKSMTGKVITAVVGAAVIGVESYVWSQVGETVGEEIADAIAQNELNEAVKEDLDELEFERFD